MVSELNLRIKFSAGGKLPLIVVFSTKKILLMLCVDVWSKKEFVYLKLQMHQRVVEMIILSAESKYKMKKQAKHGIVVEWLLSFDFITSRAKRRSSLWATQRDDMANLKNWNTKRIRDCVQLRHSSDTSSFLVEVAFKFFAFYPNCIPSLSLNASQKTQYLCGQEFGGIVTFAQTFLLFFCAFVQKFNNEKKKLKMLKPKKKIALSPVSQNQKNVFTLNSCLSFWKSKTHLFFFQRKVFLIFFPPHK